jgi:hypothetical protein
MLAADSSEPAAQALAPFDASGRYERDAGSCEPPCSASVAWAPGDERRLRKGDLLRPAGTCRVHRAHLRRAVKIPVMVLFMPGSAFSTPRLYVKRSPVSVVQSPEVGANDPVPAVDTGIC